MRVAIHSVDGMKYPNLALMRISAWHKAQGDTVEWFAPLAKYDRIYASKIFTFTPDDPYLPPDTIKGGTGYNVTSRLPKEIDETPPDYSIYPQFSAAYGFLTRGCPNKCPWCVVPHKEGGLRVVADIEDICRTNTGFRHKAILMDNNFLAAPLDFCREQIDKMRRLKIRADFNQATDARLYNEDTARVMATMPFLKYARISCDTDAMLPHCVRAISLLRKFGYRGDVFCYVLSKADGIASALDRIYGLMAADRRAIPFVMPYRDFEHYTAEVAPELRRLARWCNRAWIRKACRFCDYK